MRNSFLVLALISTVARTYLARDLICIIQSYNSHIRKLAGSQLAVYLSENTLHRLPYYLKKISTFFIQLISSVSPREKKREPNFMSLQVNTA